MPGTPSFFVHPQGLCESDTVGAGTRIWAFAHVLPGAVIGSDCNICDHAFIEGGAVNGSGDTLKNAVLAWNKLTKYDQRFHPSNPDFPHDPPPRTASK